MKNTGNVAIVTGGARGIGRAITESLLKEGYSVVFIDVIEDLGNTARMELRKEFPDLGIDFIKCDITSNQEFEAAFLKVKEIFGHIDILVNCAGVADEINWEKTYEVNFKGAIRGCMLAFRYLEDKDGNKGGTVVNIASVFGLGIEPMKYMMSAMPVYTATKHGLVSFSRMYGDDINYRDTKVKVMTVCPGCVETPILKSSADLSLNKSLCLSVQATVPKMLPNAIGDGVIKILQNDVNGAVMSVELEGQTYFRFAELVM